MDILYLVDRIEAILHAGQKVPLSSKVIVARADGKAEEIRAGADQYALEVLRALEAHMSKTMETVRGGIKTLEESIRESQEGVPPGNGA